MITLESVKTILQLKNENHDGYLAELIPFLVEYTKDYCNNTFLDINGEESFPGGVNIFVAKACEYLMNQSGINSRGMGAVSYSFETDFPTSLMRLLRPYRKVKFS